MEYTIYSQAYFSKLRSCDKESPDPRSGSDLADLLKAVLDV